MDAFVRRKTQQGEASAAQLPPMKKEKGAHVPLAERVRPKSIDGVIGQEHLLGADSMIRKLIAKDSLPSIILWGPPGCGKTTIARALAQATQSHFVQISAVTAGIADVKEVVQEAQRQRTYGRATLLFVDEIHRFNKAQQDAFLPHVESGLLKLVGATTENPSFEVNSALLSRCRVFTLEKLSVESLEEILRKALSDDSKGLGGAAIQVEDAALHFLASVADGDARVALNALDMTCEAAPCDAEFGLKSVTLAAAKEAFQKTHLLYDKNGEEHYNIISALHKSIRGSDADAALYWLGRMLESGEDPKYVARRLVRFAAEDVGIADPAALQLAVAAFQAVTMIGMPECDVCLAECVVYLARAPKSILVYKAYEKVKACIRERPTEPVPLHIRNAPTGLMKNLGYGKGYKYNPDFGYQPGAEINQSYLPTALAGTKFLDDQAPGAVAGTGAASTVATMLPASMIVDCEPVEGHASSAGRTQAAKERATGEQVLRVPGEQVLHTVIQEEVDLHGFAGVGDEGGRNSPDLGKAREPRHQHQHQQQQQQPHETAATVKKFDV